ncbi:DUF4136 domain-containing protein [Caulobacter sp. 17J80-11]|uniref:DUF4136 domain-containing protein n=1 Tax=Caulobacter sp. 17J80-11 TaxID=2763502 RepID=UPI00165385D1|nr:DUF4136 domain-containing protein [Caulobacter sp. 17J80-11]MBC6982138.1 DUF4136 domain-containing protein [Caulobacter sp. 17J80-11]
MTDRRRLLGLAAGLSVALGLSACATGPNINTDYDRSVDFSSFHTFSLASDTPQPGAPPLTWQRVSDAINRTLQARGFTRSDTPDFAVGFTLGKRDRIETWNYGPYYGAWGQSGGGWWNAQTHVRTITEGTLTIDVFDAKTRRPVWSGTATQRLSGPVSQAEIDAAVTSVLAKFPPTSGN